MDNTKVQTDLESCLFVVAAATSAPFTQSSEFSQNLCGSFWQRCMISAGTPAKAKLPVAVQPSGSLQV
eukprot:3967221-Amphidinium_carterae.1